MRKIVFIYSAVILMVANDVVFAQNVKFGVKGGLNLATIKYEVSQGGITAKLDNMKFKPSFYLGGLAEFGFRNSEKLKIQVELLYTGNGTSIKISSSGDTEVKFKIYQLTLPVLVKYYLIKNLALCGGAYLGYVFDISNIDSDTEIIKFSQENYNKRDGGLAIGVEYSITSGLFADIRYNYGLADLNSFDRYGIEMNMFNRFLQIGLGYKF